MRRLLLVGAVLFGALNVDAGERWTGPMVLYAAPEMYRDPEAVRVMRDATEKAAKASGVDVRVGLRGNVMLRVDADHPFQQWNTIAEARRYGFPPTITFRHRDALVDTRMHGNILLHEIGHMLGLEHGDDPKAIMWGKPWLLIKPQDFNHEELAQLRELYRSREASR